MVRDSWFVKHEISSKLLIILLLSQFVPDYLFWVLSCAIIILDIIRHGGKLKSIKMPGSIFFWSLFLLGCFGSLSSLGNIEAWIIVRDIVRMLYIPTYWVLSCVICDKEKADYRVYYKTFFLFAGIYSFIELIIRLTNYAQNINASAIFRTFVSAGMINEYVIGIAMFIAFFKPDCNKGYYVSKIVDRIIKFIIFISFVLSFSRTSLLIFGFLVLFIGLRNARSMIKIIVFGVIAIIMVVSFMPGIVSTFIDKIEFSGTEILSNRSYWDNTSIVHGWRGYEVFCAKETFSSYNLLHKVIGGGFGSSVDVHGYAFLVTSEDKLPYLHNGYYTNLIKFGVIGIALTICIFFSIWSHSKNLKHNDYNRKLSTVLVFSLVVTMFFIHGIFWGQASLVIFLPIAWAFCYDAAK